jgi:hypothetical protein
MLMKDGYRSTAEFLTRDRDMEEELAAKLEALAAGQTDSDMDELLRDIARRCRKNRDKITQMMEAMSAPDYQVTLKCPVCGWAIPYGTNPVPGTEVKCELCSIWFKLIEKEGDYLLENMGRRDGRA